jgi:hypothetical protein
MTTATYQRPTKSLRAMTADERREHYARVDVELAKVSADLATEFRRRNLPTECVIPDYLRWGRSRMQCILMVRHSHPSTAAIKVSRAGDAAVCSFLPLSKIEQRPQTSGRFVLAMVPKWLREKLPPAFSGVTPELVGDDWSDSERAEWDDLAAICWKINYEIDMAPRRRNWPERSAAITSTISPSNAA